MNQHSEVLDFDDGCKVCFHTKRQRGGIHLNIRNMFESWGGACREVFKVTGSRIFLKLYRVKDLK